MTKANFVVQVGNAVHCVKMANKTDDVTVCSSKVGRITTRASLFRWAKLITNLLGSVFLKHSTGEKNHSQM
jgi:hypothetical protein